MLYTLHTPVIHGIHRGQHLQDPGEAAPEHGGVIIAARLIVLALPRLQGAEGGAGVAERGEIPVCDKQFINLTGHSVRNIADPHQKALDQERRPLRRPRRAGETPAQKLAGGLRHSGPQDGALHQGGLHPCRPLAAPMLPDQVPPGPAEQVGPLDPPGVAAV